MAEELPTANTRPQLSPSIIDTKTVIIAVLVGLLTLSLFVGMTYLLFVNPESTAALRDIVIIYFGLLVVLITVLLAVLTAALVYLGLKLNDLIQLLRREVTPALKNLQGTMSEVRGTASFISDHAVQPVIETASIISATRTVVANLFRRD